MKAGAYQPAEVSHLNLPSWQKESVEMFTKNWKCVTMLLAVCGAAAVPLSRTADATLFIPFANMTQSPGWSVGNYNLYSKTTGAAASATFTCSQGDIVQLVYKVDGAGVNGDATVVLDSNSPYTLNTNGTIASEGYLYTASSAISAGTHTLSVAVAGTGTGAGRYIQINGINIYSRPTDGNLLLNGGFESPAMSPTPGVTTFAAGMSGSTGWTSTGARASVVLNSTGGWNTQEGDRCCHLGDAWSQSGITQTFDTNVGQLYQLSFYATGISGGSADGQSGTVSVGDLTTTTFTTDPGAYIQNDAWKQFTYQFHATDSQSTLTLLNLGGTNGISVDNISIHSVPEPSTFVMFVSALFGLVAYAWRKRKS